MSVLLYLGIIHAYASTDFVIVFMCVALICSFYLQGDLQSTVLLMRDCAYEASVALTAFSHISRIHTALTSECGSILEEVL